MDGKWTGSVTWELRQGDCIERMSELEAESIDAVVTDPPYGIGFMGHDWDQPGEHGPLSAGHGGCKPIELMRWLIRLVTPPGGALLDPFTGSGSTGCAAVLEGLDFIGLEREPDYIEIAQARIPFWEQHGEDALLAMAAAERAAATRTDLADVGQLDLLGDAA